MTRPLPRLARFLVTTTLAAASLHAVAQMGGGGMGGGMRGGHGGGMGERGPQRSPSAEAPTTPARPDIQPQLQQLQADLALTPQQQLAWDALRLALLDVEWPHAQPVSASAQVTAMGVLQQELTQAQNRYTLLETVADRLRALQAQLAPAQQQKLDAQLPALVQLATGRRAGAPAR